MSEYSERPPRPGTVPVRRAAEARRDQGGSRDVISIFGLVLPAVALVLSSFAPWISLRLPGLEYKYLSLNELSGGRLLVGLVAVLLVVGIPLSVVRHRFGTVITSLGVALFGWFAGLAVLVIGLVRSLIPDIALVGIDVGDGLLGQGPGVVLALGAAMILSAELSLGFTGAALSTRTSNLYGFSALVVIVGLAAANHSQWVVVDSEKLNSQIAVSGDSLFGSVVISIMIWGAAAFAAGHLAGIPAAKPRGLAVLLILMSVLKVFQLVVVWAGTSFLDWTLPNSIGSVADLELKAGFYFSVGLTAAAIGIAIFGLVSPVSASRAVSVRPLALVPSGALVVATIAMGFFFNSQPAVPVIASDSTVFNESLAATTTSTQPSPLTTIAVAVPNGDAGTDTAATLSTAYVVIADEEDDICVFGSGAFVGDGSYVITNEHVIDSSDLAASCTWLWVGFGEDPSTEPDTWYTAEVLWRDATKDLAILVLPELRPGETRPLEVRYEKMKLGDEISIFGFPGIGGETLTLTKGIISGFDVEEGYYKVSAAINGGNSGGPVLDLQGRLIGIASAVFRSKVTCEESQTCYTEGTNVGLVRPISLAQAAIKEFVK